MRSMPSAVNLQNLRRRKKRAISVYPYSIEVMTQARLRGSRIVVGIAATPTIVAARRAFFLRPRHRRRLEHRRGHGNDHVPDHGIAETETAGEFVESVLVAFDVHQHVMRLVHLGNRVRQLPATPILQAMDGTAPGSDDAAV